MAAGRPKKYKSGKTLTRAVEAYFAAISRTATAQEMYDTGVRDENGHAVMASREILNDSGEPIRYTEYIVPPTVGGLCEFLGISRQTWNAYADDEEYLDATTRARGRMQTYLEGQLLTRAGKDIKGVMFNLENNYGMRERVEHEIGPRAERAAAVSEMSLDEKMEYLRGITAKLGSAGDEEE